MVTFTQGQVALSFTADKTYAEVVAANEAGKIVRCSVSGTYFGQLVEVSNNDVVFGLDSISRGLLSSNDVFTIHSDDTVEYNSLHFYNPQFVQDVISATAWSDGVYSFESHFSNTFFDIEVELSSTATSEQLEAWSNAKPTAVFGTNTMKALGDVPTVDIPVIVKVLFNLKMQENGGEK